MLTLKEIKEQYGSMQQTQDYLAGQADKVRALFDQNANSLIIFLGSGSSFSLAQAFAQNTITGLKRNATAMTAGEVLVHGERYAAMFQGAIVVAISRSGETSEIIRALDAVKKYADIRLIAVTCKVNTPLGALGDVALEMPWAFDNSVCQTRTVSCLYFTWVYIVGKLSGNAALLADLQKVIDGGDAFLAQWEEPFKKFAEGAWDHVVVLGDAEIGGVCEEGALAFKEICQLPSNFYHVLDLRHGPMVLIGEKTLVILPLSNHAAELQKALLEDVKKKGATVIAYTNKDEKLEGEGVMNVSFGQELSYPVMGLPMLLIAQLVSYYKSLVTGTDPDNPTGLTAWIKL
ncbi:MAG: SIS domain-containing protein [Clostridiales bacterium]|nr:SIS domain-containing protein [Clostridiales bacterium]